MRPGFDPWVGKIPWRRAWQPSPVFLPGESPWTEESGGLQSRGGHKKLDMTRWLSTAQQSLQSCEKDVFEPLCPIPTLALAPPHIKGNADTKGDSVPVSQSLWEDRSLNSNGHLTPRYETTFCHKNERRLFPSASYLAEMATELPGEFRMNSVWLMVLSSPPTWGLVIIILKMGMYWASEMELAVKNLPVSAEDVWDVGSIPE